MNLFEINNEIGKLFDEETGEIFDIEALELLEMKRDDKLRNCIALYKNLSAEAKALKEAKLELGRRQSQKEKAALSVLKYLSDSQNGSNYECVEGKLSFRKSTTTEIINEEAFFNWDGRWLYGSSEFIPSKEDIGNAIKEGKEIPGWARIDHLNASIK